ncbi:hypothetical protein Hanom_Chr15g01375401 [Helianthus anomalus]
MHQHPLADSQKGIETIKLLLEVERSFNLYPASSGQLSISNLSYSNKVPILLDLDELDSYPTPVNVKKETPTTTSSKAIPAPKLNPRTHASTAKKRKGSEISTLGSEGFSYEELSFTDSLEPMTSFLNKVISCYYILHIYLDGISWLVNFNSYLNFDLQGLQHLLHLYTDACGTAQLYEAKIKQLKTTIVDQGTIVAAQTRH